MKGVWDGTRTAHMPFVLTRLLIRVKSMRVKHFKREMTGYFFIAPSFLLFLAFLVYPAFEAVRISFYHLTLADSTFIGWRNFVDLYHDKVFMGALYNTLKYVVLIVPACLAFSIFIAAVIYNKNAKLTSFYRAVFYIPAVASVVAVSLIWQWIYNPVLGIANYLLTFVGLEPLNWLADAKLALLSIVIVILTGAVGQPIVLYTAALGGIPRDYYEASSIDGAGKYRQFFSITVPLVSHTTLYVLIIATIHAFQTFAVINLLTKGGPNGATNSIVFELYQTAFQYSNYGYASAMGTVLFVMIGIISFFQFKFMTQQMEK